MLCLRVVAFSGHIADVAETVSKMANSVPEHIVYLEFNAVSINMTELTVDEAIRYYQERINARPKT